MKTDMLEHDREKLQTFREKDHAQNKASWSEMTIRNAIILRRLEQERTR
jgi:hypothetical protein